MVRCKNVGGGPSDGDESPPRVTEVARGKRKKLAVKKRKRTSTKAEIAQVVADAAERAERDGRGSGIHIGERCFHLDDRQLGTEAIEGTEDPPTEQPTEDPTCRGAHRGDRGADRSDSIASSLRTYACSGDS
jgi:hypothetical protein